MKNLSKNRKFRRSLWIILHQVMKFINFIKTFFIRESKRNRWAARRIILMAKFCNLVSFETLIYLPVRSWSFNLQFICHPSVFILLKLFLIQLGINLVQKCLIFFSCEFLPNLFYFHISPLTFKTIFYPFI